MKLFGLLVEVDEENAITGEIVAKNEKDARKMAMKDLAEERTEYKSITLLELSDVSSGCSVHPIKLNKQQRMGSDYKLFVYTYYDYVQDSGSRRYFIAKDRDDALEICQSYDGVDLHTKNDHLFELQEISKVGEYDIFVSVA